MGVCPGLLELSVLHTWAIQKLRGAECLILDFALLSLAQPEDPLSNDQ